MKTHIISTDIAELQATITALSQENDALRHNITVLERQIHVGAALRAESLIARLTGGRLSVNNEGHDVHLENIDILLEVKFSRLNIADKRKKNPTSRWAWHKIFGSGGMKRYDRLVLIGEKDERYAQFYLEKNRPVVVFDIPYDEVQQYTIKTSVRSHEMRSIQLSTNPRTVFSAASKLFQRHQTTLRDLEINYRGKCAIIKGDGWSRS